MHVAVPDLRALRQGGLVIRYAMLGPIAFVLAEVPASGSSGTSIERPTQGAHWALVIAGEITYHGPGGALRIPAGSALFVPGGGPEHRFEATAGSRIAAFQPVDPSIEITDPLLAQQGFEVVAPDSIDASSPMVVQMAARSAARPGDIDARTSWMPPYALTVAQFGLASGYTADWCDAPHWGLVTGGQLVIEYEHDVEIVSAGDVYYCPQGSPAHRLQAADPAAILDLTPIDAIAGGGRIAGWRRTALAEAGVHEDSPISVVPLS